MIVIRTVRIILALQAQAVEGLIRLTMVACMIARQIIAGIQEHSGIRRIYLQPPARLRVVQDTRRALVCVNLRVDNIAYIEALYPFGSPDKLIAYLAIAERKAPQV